MSEQTPSTPSEETPGAAPNDKLEQEKAALIELESKPFLERSLGYAKRTGPGLLQSAMTLGAGSAAASVVAGASFGYKLLWVQPVAIFLGVMMFMAISNIVLTTKERPYGGFQRELGSIWGWLRILVILWGFGTVTASIIWHFSQYSLAAGAGRSIVQQFAPDLVLDKEVDQKSFFTFDTKKIDPETKEPIIGKDGKPEMITKIYTPVGYGVSFAAGFVILLTNIIVVFNYGRGGVGIRIYEWFLRIMIGVVILTFLLVVLLNIKEIKWLEVLKGFTGWYGIPGNSDPAEYSKNITTVLGMLGAAVGINMTFLYPYSLLKKGWGKEHKTLVKWDLMLTMFLPFALVTSLIMVAMTVSGIYTGEDLVRSGISPLEAAGALRKSGMSESLATIIFCGGLFGMTCGAISAHMTCCGFTLCEMLGLEQTTNRFRLFALTPTIGVLGCAISLPFWFPVFASAVCLTMLPIAYLIFLIMNNRRSYIGDAVGKGFKRVAFNAVLVIALIMATIGSAISIKKNAYDKIFPPKEVAKTESESPDIPKTVTETPDLSDSVE